MNTDKTIDLVERTRMALSTLPPAQEQVMRMRFGIGTPGNKKMDEAEIAEKVGKTEADVRELLSAAVARLRDLAAFITDGAAASRH